jgi:hypothetical protein
MYRINSNFTPTIVDRTLSVINPREKRERKKKCHQIIIQY